MPFQSHSTPTRKMLWVFDRMILYLGFVLSQVSKARPFDKLRAGSGAPSAGATSSGQRPRKMLQDAAPSFVAWRAPSTRQCARPRPRSQPTGLAWRRTGHCCYFPHRCFPWRWRHCGAGPGTWPAHRRTVETALELRLFQVGQPFQSRIHQFRARLQAGVDGDGRLAVPWTDVLANIAAEDLAAHQLHQFRGNGAAMLDRQVRDTTRRIHPVGRNQRAGGASFQAATAASAAVRLLYALFPLGREVLSGEPPKTHTTPVWDG